jgi:hypothetical protein
VIAQYASISGPTVFDLDFAALDPSQVLQANFERSYARLGLRIAADKTHQHTDPAHAIDLLRERCNRPRRRPAEQGDKLTTLQLSEHCNGLLARSQPGLFDYMIGAHQDGSWKCNPEAFGSLHVDGEFQFGRKLDREIGGARSVQDLVNVGRGAMQAGIEINAITNEAASLDVDAISIYGWQVRCRSGSAKPRLL